MPNSSKKRIASLDQKQALVGRLQEKSAGKIFNAGKRLWFGGELKPTVVIYVFMVYYVVYN